MFETFIAKARRSLARDRDLPVSERVRKAASYLVSTTAAPLYLRGCDKVGARVRAIGRPVIRKQGRIEIGSDVVLNSKYSPVEFAAVGGGTITLGDRVHINYGTSISTRHRIALGNDVSIGPYSIIGSEDELPFDEAPADIDVGEGVWLAARVTVLPGARIGAGSTVTAGSIVSGDIPAGVVAGGIPARTISRIHDTAPEHDASAQARRASPPATSRATTAALLPPLRGLVLADFTTGTLAAHLQDPREQPAMIVVDAPYCQTSQMLLAEPRADAKDFLIVWTRPEIVSSAFQRLLSGDSASQAELESDVTAFADLVKRAADGYRVTLVPTWTLPSHARGRGMTDSRRGGLNWGVTIMNHSLMERFNESSTAFVLNAERWLQASSDERGSARAWYLGKIPFHSEVFAEASADIKAAARGLNGQARKLLILDLDDTLWGGIVGDVGWENLQLGGHDSLGEAYVDFQRAIKNLKNRGILLALVSKNTEEIALDAMRSHPEMILKPEDFSAWRINWSDKAQNVADVVAELNLGLQSAVFIDDNPVERARVRDTLPEVLVPDWPEDKLLYPARLLALSCFDAPALTAEDTQRGSMYAAERERQTERERVGSVDEWLASLDMKVRVEPLSPTNIARTTQLLNKTNQMNLTTRRLTETELLAWCAESTRAVWAISVSDKFGPAGLTGILGLEKDGAVCRIVDFVLSCRVMGRRVEETLAHLATEWARAQGLGTVVAKYLPTKKNKPCYEFWLRSGFTAYEDSLEFDFKVDETYPLPSCISIEWDGAK